MDSPLFYRYQGSQESLNSDVNYFYTPPVVKSKNQVFFNSDDSLYKSELRKLNIPRIEIQSDEPVFNLRVTDFSEPLPRDVTAECEGPYLNNNEFVANKSWKNKTSSYVQHKSYSLDVTEIPSIEIQLVGDNDVPASDNTNKLIKPLMYSSLQDLSSSTSSVNSGVHDSNLDLSAMDPDTPVKHWKSPNEIRKGHVKALARQFEDVFAERQTASNSGSVPDLNKCGKSKTQFRSEERLNDRLTDFERLEVLKLLRDWSIHGSEAKTDFTLKFTSCEINTKKETNLKKHTEKSRSEPDLSPKTETKNGAIFNKKFNSESNVNTKEIPDVDFWHKCSFRNCIFNDKHKSSGTNIVESERPKPKSILKNRESLNNIVNKQHRILQKDDRRHSEIIESKACSDQFTRCDSLECLTRLRKKKQSALKEIKKFPESYIVTRKNSINNQKQQNEDTYKYPSSKVVVFRKNYAPKTWKSCSDIKFKPKLVRKCCKNAKKTCPIYRCSSDNSPRKSRSCVSITDEDIAKTDTVRDFQVGSCCSKNCELYSHERFIFNFGMDYFYSIADTQLLICFVKLIGAAQFYDRSISYFFSIRGVTSFIFVIELCTAELCLNY